MVLLRAFLTDDGGPATSNAPAQAAPAPANDGPRFYTVRVGDTLASIARTMGIPLERLERLNPNVEPTSLFIGDRIRLR